jgi:hypothetical protein
MSVVTESDDVGYAASYDGDVNIVIKHVRVVQGPQTMVTQREGLYSTGGFDRCETAMLTENRYLLWLATFAAEQIYCGKNEFHL